MNVCDWRDLAPELLAPHYERAGRQWMSALWWDTSGAWRSLEQARTTWGLPGLVAVDDAGRIRGWTFFLPQDNVLHVGGISAETSLATRALLDAVVDVCGTSGADGVSCFIFDEAPGAARVLHERGFDTEPFLYLSRILGPAAPHRPASGADAWRTEDVSAAAVLLREAYEPDAAKYMAPGHTPAAWERYVRNLVEQTGLGELNPAATRVVRAGSRIEALVVTTALSASTMHLAQVAVHPSRRGEGLAKALVEDACTLAADQGYARVTLLVGSTNAAARRLYEELGFTAGAQFLAARRGREQPAP